MERATVHAGVLGLALLTAACATGRASPGAVNPEEQLSEAVRDLEREDFALARQRLIAVAFQCADDRRQRRALLLLASTELDTGNPRGSPATAAGFAARYLLQPDTSPEDRMLARTLYRIATRVETLTPHVASGGEDSLLLIDAPDPCRSTASIPGDRLWDSLGSGSAPWLLEAQTYLDVLRRRVTELEAEIARIKGLLTSAPPPDEQDR